MLKSNIDTIEDARRAGLSLGRGSEGHDAVEELALLTRELERRLSEAQAKIEAYQTRQFIDAREAEGQRVRANDALRMLAEVTAENDRLKKLNTVLHDARLAEQVQRKAIARDLDRARGSVADEVVKQLEAMNA